MKKICRDIIILYMSTKNDDQMMYCSWDMVCDRCNCYFSFWASFGTFTPLTTQNIKILEKWKKKTLEISSFYKVCEKLWSDDIQFLIYSSWYTRYGAQGTDGQTDRQMDRQKKWHIEVCAPPENSESKFKNYFNIFL